MTITFQNGSIYQYSGVPINEFYAMAQNGGAGTYFHAKIRNKYPTTKIFDPRIQ